MKLVFEGIGVYYRKKAVLDNLSFGLEEGSITVIIGRNGAGKSTLVRALMGDVRGYEGRILLDGQDVRGIPMGELARRVAYLPQNLPRPHVTVRELVSFGRTPYTSAMGKMSDADREAVDSAIEAADMDGFENAFVDTLSGGERKKAFFAMILAQDAPTVVLDEPMAHLDTVSRFEFWELIRRQRGKTFLVVAHDLPEVLRWADRIVTVHDRSVVFDGTPDECLERGIPERYFRMDIRKDSEGGYSVKPIK